MRKRAIDFVLCHYLVDVSRHRRIVGDFSLNPPVCSLPCCTVDGGVTLLGLGLTVCGHYIRRGTGWNCLVLI